MTLKIDWERQPLGQVSDGSLARTLNCSRSAAMYQREKRGIAAVGEPPRKVRCDWNNVPLGGMEDSKIAKMLRCSSRTVAYQRKKRGIPKYEITAYLLPMSGWGT